MQLLFRAWRGSPVGVLRLPIERASHFGPSLRYRPIGTYAVGSDRPRPLPGLKIQPWLACQAVGVAIQKNQFRSFPGKLSLERGKIDFGAFLQEKRRRGREARVRRAQRETGRDGRGLVSAVGASKGEADEARRTRSAPKTRDGPRDGGGRGVRYRRAGGYGGDRGRTTVERRGRGSERGWWFP